MKTVKRCMRVVVVALMLSGCAQLCEFGLCGDGSGEDSGTGAPPPTPSATPIATVPATPVPTFSPTPVVVPTEKPTPKPEPVPTPGGRCDTRKVYTTSHGVKCTRHPEAVEDCKVLRKGDGRGGFLGINSDRGIYKVLLPAKFTCRVLPAKICGAKSCVELLPTPDEEGAWSNPDEEGAKRYCRLHYAAKLNARGIIAAIGTSKGELKVEGEKGVCSLALDLTRERND